MIKLKERRFGLDARRKFFTQRELRHWCRLPEEAVAVLCLELFRDRLDGAWGP